VPRKPKCVLATLVWGLLLAPAAAAAFQNPGPDVICGEINGPSNWGQENSIVSYSLGAIDCNIGTVPLEYFDATPRHPLRTCAADVNGDDRVDGEDVRAFVATLLSRSFVPRPVAEPASGGVFPPARAAKD